MYELIDGIKYIPLALYLSVLSTDHEFSATAFIHNQCRGPNYLRLTLCPRIARLGDGNSKVA